MRDYKKLDIWKIGREIAKEVYLLTGNFPQSEIYGLISQMRRASVGIVSNIAEGCRCDSNKEFIHFLRISMGSVKELETQFYISLDINYIDEEKFDIIMKKLDELSKKIFSYIKYLKGEEK